MIVVYVWPGILQGNVGHASMNIESDASHPAEYVSWWPAGGGLGEFLTDQTIPGTYHTFDEDDAAEGHANFHTVSIFGLDEDAMRTWWSQWRSDPTYRLFHKNCATTVANGLSVGNHDSLSLDDSSLWTPFGVWMYAQQIYFTKSFLG